VSTATAPRPETARGAHGVATILAATLLAAAAGAALGGVLAPSGSEPPASDAAPRVGLASGVARLALPDGWQPLGRHSSLPGLEEATAVRGVHSEVALDIRAPESASLLPAGVEAAAPGRLPEPRPRRLRARTVWRYDLPGARPGERVVALALPTTGGVVTIACASIAAEIAGAASECERAAQAVQLDGASALVPAPETAAAIVLPPTAARLDRRRSLERRRLAKSRSPGRRSAAARGLARGYADAAARLRALAAGDAVRLTASLGALGRRYGALATASRRRDAGATRRAGAAIEREERRLGSLLAAVTRPAAGR
jgi:hypothetical protein